MKEKHLNEIKAQLNGVVATYDKTTAAEFMSNLADWAYGRYEDLTYDGEVEISEED
ncbi:MAG: hypothetical protein R3Y50_08010 [Rikenellaceae bacterium]